MYRYDVYDHRLVADRTTQFRDQVRRYLAGELGEEEFKQLRLRNGVYLQRHAYMLRVAVPYGLLNARQLRMLAAIARDFDRGYGHLSTRQNVQFNWPRLADIPDILDRLASVEMHAIQTSGNLVRNITSDHLAGVAPDEIEDPRPWCELLRQWSTLHPEFSWLPRKFKIAVIGAKSDRSAIHFHDIGLRIVHHSSGERGFQVLVGGGLGRTPVIGKLLREFLPARELLSYIEAVLRVYNLAGRRDNPQKARIKILVNTLGLDAFRTRVEAEWLATRGPALEVDEHEIATLRGFFAPPAYDSRSAIDPEFPARVAADPAFERWYVHNTLAHKVDGYRIVVVPLKTRGRAPGDIWASQLEALAGLAERYTFGEVRTTHEQNLVLADVAQRDLEALWRGLDDQGLAHPNAGTVTDMICCPGLDFCALANAGSINVARAVQERFERLDRLYDIGEVKLKVSGCMNACGHHHVGHIGILGVDKHGAEWYQFTLGGSADDDAALGQRLGAAVEKARVAEVVEQLLDVYLALREPSERFIDTYRRVGIAPFRERIHGIDTPTQDHCRPLAACA